MASDTVTRVCETCKDEHPLTKEFFPISGPTKDGQRYFRHMCRECYKAQCRERDRGRRTETWACRWCKQPIRHRRSLYCSPICRITENLGGLGKRYGRLLTLRIEQHTRNQRSHFVRCRCDCGKEPLVAPGNLLYGNVQSCGCLLRDYWNGTLAAGGEKHPGWKGGRRQTDDGYVTLYKPGHPNAYRNSGTNKRSTTVMEHVYVMSEYLGRPLRKSESVHHKNGQRHDNRIENLELWAVAQPAGQRVVDLVSWAEEILTLYKPELPKLAAIGA